MAVALTEERVSADVFRERFEHLAYRYGITYADVARELGYFRKRSRSGTIHPDSQKACRLIESASVDYDTACALCRALDLDPHEAGV